MAAIDDLINKIEDRELRDRMKAEVDKLFKQKKFGLVFEDHVPECTALYDVPIHIGSKVALKNTQIETIYVVQTIHHGKAKCLDTMTKEIVEYPLDRLVSIAEFGEAIYPYLKPIDSIQYAPDSDLWHTLIEADNYHALQLLEYLYAGQVDCIYIDPPYNTGAKDWKYNNDYVDSSDSYRHSKWLSMMEKRLKLAKKLLNPKDSVLICTIDEKEYLHLGCLLNELFQNAKIQMVSSVINPKGSARDFGFSRAEEYIFFCFIGSSAIIPSSEDMLRGTVEGKAVRWASLQRSGTDSRRFECPNLFYPIYFNEADDTFHSTGDSLPLDKDRNEIIPPKGTYAVYPLGRNLDERRWQLSQSTFEQRLSVGYVKFGAVKKEKKTRAISYLSNGVIEQINSGQIEITGYDEDGCVLLSTVQSTRPLSVWNKSSHSASEYGTSLNRAILPDRKFPFPKSLYAVRDTLKFFVANKPNALILDFFAGSGTTLHAVNLLNAEDGGNRRCILVTNNEVSYDESKDLRKAGCQPGDPEWERLGVAHHVTWPRTVCSIKGEDVNGKPLEGNYLDSDLSMANGFQANAAFFKLGFLDKNAVALGRQLEELIPILWMKTGCVGSCPTPQLEDQPSMLLFPENGFAVLVNEHAFSEFKEKVNAEESIQKVFIVTDSVNGYREMIAHLQVEVSYQLYRDYLDNFRINTGR